MDSKKRQAIQQLHGTCLVTPVSCIQFLIMFVSPLFANEEYLAIEANALKSRNNIRTVSAELRVQRPVRIDPDKGFDESANVVFRTMSYSIWQSDSFQRIDSRSNGVSVSGSSDLMLIPRDGTYESRLILNPDGYMLYSPTEYGTVGRVALRVGGNDERGAVANAYFDPRFVGLLAIPPGLWHAHSAEEFFDSSGGRFREVSTVEFHGVPMVLLVHTTPNGQVIRKWIEPNRQYAVHQVELETKGKSRRIYQIRSLLKEYPNGVHYPEKCFYKLIRDDIVTETEEWTVVAATFDETINDSVFSIGGLGVGKGNPIVRVPAPDKPVEMRLWNGEREVEVKPEVRPISDLPSGRSKHPLFLLVNISIFIAIVWIWRRTNKAR